MAGGKSVFAVMVLGGVLALSAAQTPAAFEKGVIDVRPDADFGQGTDWAKFIDNECVALAVAGDGSVFLAQQRAHTVHKFDRSGRLVRSFGRQGQGPGDFRFPQYLSILDHRFLVVGEQAESRRISLFDLDGRFVRLVKTGQAPFNVLALRDGVIAYVAKSFPARAPWSSRPVPRFSWTRAREKRSRLATTPCSWTRSRSSPMPREGCPRKAISGWAR